MSGMKPKQYLILFAIYLLIVLAFFGRLFFMKGAITGGDWNFPVTHDQIDLFFKSSKFSWTHQGNLFGLRQIAPMSIIFALALKSFSLTGIGGALALKIVLVFIFALAAANFNLFLTYLKVDRKIAFLGGLLFITTPIFFNYSLMGWLFVLLAMALMPLFVYFLLLSIDRNNYAYALAAALVFSLAILQSQVLIWYPLIILAIVLSCSNNLKTFLISIKMAGIVLAAFVFINLYWLPSSLLYPDYLLTGKELVQSSVSLGTSIRLSSYNIIRLWGSLFNNQFESSFINLPQYLSFLLPALALAAILHYRRYRRAIVFLLFLLVVPFLFYAMDRTLLARLPFSNVFRDVARFATLSTFAAITLAMITLNNLASAKARGKVFLLIGIIIILAVNAWPFFSGAFFSQGNFGYDFRFRDKDWPSEYYALDQQFREEGVNKRAIFLPIGGMLSYTSDDKFSGPFRESWDVFANFSPVPGMIGLSDRNNGVTSDLIWELNESLYNLDFAKFDRLLEVAEIDLVVLRRDVELRDERGVSNLDLENGFNQLAETKKTSVYFDSGSTIVYNFGSREELRACSSLITSNAAAGKSVKALYPSRSYQRVLSGMDFNQIENMLPILSQLKKEQCLTFDGQNEVFSQARLDPSQAKIFEFTSLEKIIEVIRTKKWQAEQQNLNLRTDKGIKEGNQFIIDNAEEMDLNGQEKNKYVADIDRSFADSRLYFKKSGDPKTPLKVNLNQHQYEIDQKDPASGLYYIDRPSLIVGLNWIESENLSPLFVIEGQGLPNAAPPQVNYDWITPTKMKVKVENIKDDFVLQLSETFNVFWKIFSSDKLSSKTIINEDNHFIANSFANGWSIKISDLKAAGVLKGAGPTKSAEFYIEFWPQRILLLGEILSVTALVVTVLLIVLKRRKADENCC